MLENVLEYFNAQNNCGTLTFLLQIELLGSQKKFTIAVYVSVHYSDCSEIIVKKILKNQNLVLSSITVRCLQHETISVLLINNSLILILYALINNVM